MKSTSLVLALASMVSLVGISFANPAHGKTVSKDDVKNWLESVKGPYTNFKGSYNDPTGQPKSGDCSNFSILYGDPGQGGALNIVFNDLSSGFEKQVIAVYGYYKPNVGVVTMNSRVLKLRDVSLQVGQLGNVASHEVASMIEKSTLVLEKDSSGRLITVQLRSPYLMYDTHLRLESGQFATIDCKAK